MFCPNCHHPLRDQAKFCNNCGATIAAAGTAAVAAPAMSPTPQAPVDMEPSAASAAQPVMSAETTLPGKASPTGPMNRAPAAPTTDRQPIPGEPAARAAAFLADEDEAIDQPPALPFDEDEMEAARAPASEGALVPPPAPDNQQAAEWQSAMSQDEGAGAVPTEQLYGLDPYAPQGAAMSMNTPDTPENPPSEESLSDDMPTLRMPQPESNEVVVTAELLSTLGEHEPLQPGMLLEGRYRIEEVVHTSEEENLYRITDQRGYLHCWACNTDFPDTGQPERFCSNCGADMLGKEYWLRERSQGAGEADRMAAASDTPGANGAYPEGAAEEAAIFQGNVQGYIDTDSEEMDWPTQPMSAIASFIVGPRHYRVEATEIEEPIFPLGVTLVAGARSDVGRTRRGNPNEDSILVMQLSRIHESVSQPFGLYIVADGLGGHDDGQTASRRAIAVIADYITREVVLPALQSGQYADGDTLAARLKAAVEAANLALVGSNEQTGSDMGSTITGALIVGDTAHIVNVGDSRTYLYDGASLQPISVDHSLVMQLVIGGLIDREDIYTHPQRNQILRSLGDRRDVQIDLFTQKLRPGYQLMMCCDGLWEMIRDPQIEQVLREVSDPQAAADRLMELANQNGGEDNISVIVVQARE